MVKIGDRRLRCYEHNIPSGRLGLPTVLKSRTFKTESNHKIGEESESVAAELVFPGLEVGRVPGDL